MQDALLLSLIAAASTEEPYRQDVTLMIGGFLVSGYIVSAEEYMKQNPVTEEFWGLVKAHRAKTPETTENATNFIHLRDAKYYLPGAKPIPANTGVFIRLSLEQVQGFSFGELEFKDK